MLFAFYLKTINTGAGNPRRGWAIYSPTALLDFVEEGYDGRAALQTAYPLHSAGNVYFGDAEPVNISPSEYRRLCRFSRSEFVRNSIDRAEA